METLLTKRKYLKSAYKSENTRISAQRKDSQRLSWIARRSCLATEILFGFEADQDGAVDGGAFLVDDVEGHGRVVHIHHTEGADVLSETHALLVGPNDVTSVGPHLSPRLRRDRIVLVTAVADGDVVDTIEVLMLQALMSYLTGQTDEG